MTCKDCVHYEVCQNKAFEEAKLSVIAETVIVTIKNRIVCKFFKNKADFVEVKHGEWKKYRVTEGHIFVCSLCGYRTLVDFEGEFLYHNYCPRCGADMRKGGADNGKIH